MATNQPAAVPASTDWRRLPILVGVLAAALVAILSAFALPPLNSEPHEIPVAAVGPAPAVERVSRQLLRQHPDGFEIIAVNASQQARDLILDRQVYGAVVVDESGTSILIASAASPAVANLLKGLADRLGDAAGRPAAVNDVAPLTTDDPTGAGLAAGALPLALGGWIGAVVLLAAVRGASRRVAGALGFAVVGALALTAVLQFWFGSLTGNYWLTSAGAALGIAATAWMILGLRTALGNAGLGVGAVTLILLGNPLSGLNSAPELLPAGWGALGQLLPPGATGSLLRSLAFFDGAGSARPVSVLACWLSAGVVLFVLGERHARHTRRQGPPSVSAPATATQPAHAG